MWHLSFGSEYLTTVPFLSFLFLAPSAGQVSILSIAQQNSVVYAPSIFTIHSSIDGQPGWFYFLADVHRTATNKQIFL